MNIDKKIIAFDFFGVICSQVAPMWFKKSFPNKNPNKLTEEYFGPADVGNISMNTLITNLSKLTSKEPTIIEGELFSLVSIDKRVISSIEKMSKDHGIVIFSNAAGDFLREILRRHNLEGLFKHIIISGEIKAIKPEAEFFTKALQIVNASPEEIIFIDDNIVNVESARKLGIESIVFESPNTLEILFN